MLNKVIRDSFILAIAVIGGVLLFNNRETIYEITGFHPSQLVNNNSGKEVNANEAIIEKPQKTNYRTAITIDSSSTSIRKSPDGQFWTEARVNSASVHFLVDTGASIVALTPKDAMKSGININNLQYTAKVTTAAGQIMAAPVMLDVVSVGNVSVRNVQAVIIPKGLKTSLLGMSYLGQLHAMEVSKSQIILRQ